MYMYVLAFRIAFPPVLAEKGAPHVLCMVVHAWQAVAIHEWMDAGYYTLCDTYGCMMAVIRLLGAIGTTSSLGAPKIALRGGGGGWHGRPAKEGGGVPEMGFRAGPFVLCEDGCCH